MKRQVLLTCFLIVAAQIGFGRARSSETQHTRESALQNAAFNADDFQFRSELNEARGQIAALSTKVKNLEAARSGTWTDPRTYIALSGVLIALIGFPLVLKQIRNSAYGALYSQQNSIHEFFISNPELRPYFYTGKSIPLPEAPDYDKAIATAEMVADFMEHIYVQKDNLPRKIWPGWESYIQDLYGTSLLLQSHFKTKGSWYGEWVRQPASKR